MDAWSPEGTGEEAAGQPPPGCEESEAGDAGEAEAETNAGEAFMVEDTSTLPRAALLSQQRLQQLLPGMEDMVRVGLQEAASQHGLNIRACHTVLSRHASLIRPEKSRVYIAKQFFQVCGDGGGGWGGASRTSWIWGCGYTQQQQQHLNSMQ
jgi:hypothetical protein